MGCTQDSPSLRVLPVDNYDMGPSIARSDSFDVVHYDLVLDVTDYSGQSMQALATIDFTVIQGGGTSMWWDLQGLTVDSVHWNGNAVPFEQSGPELHVDAPAPMTEGEAVVLQVWYGGQPNDDPYWGGVYYASDLIYNLGIGLTSIPPNFGKCGTRASTTLWNAPLHLPHHKRRRTTSPQPRPPRRGGRVGRRHHPDNLGLDHPIPTHLSAMAVGLCRPRLRARRVRNHPGSTHGQGGDINAMQAKFADLGFAIDALEYWWGPYAWERVGYVLTTDGALEIPTNIAYPQFMMQQSNFANGDLFAHELGHHWWGDMVSPLLHNHMWIKEGFAEYSSHLFEEQLSGREAFVEMVKDNQQFVLEECHVQDEGFHPFRPCPTNTSTGDIPTTRAPASCTTSAPTSETRCSVKRAKTSCALRQPHGRGRL